MLHKILKYIYNLNLTIYSFSHRLKPFFNKKIFIHSTVKFRQKTIFSGKGNISIEKSVTFGYKLGGNYYNSISELQARSANSNVIIHENVNFNNSILVIAYNHIEIGAHSKIGANVILMDFESHGTYPTKRNQIGEIGKIVIGKNVWIGSNVVILKNVEIGDNSIVALGSVVLKGKYPNNVIIGGNPAKVIKIIE